MNFSIEKINHEYVLDREDLNLILEFNDTQKKGDTKIQLHLQPEPFIGNLSEAKLFLLALNPGFKGGEDGEDYWHSSHRFRDLFSNNLSQGETDYPYYYLHEDTYFEKSPGHIWCKRIFKELVQRIGAKSLSQKICCIQLHGYHSTKYKDIELKSQELIFQKIREICDANKPIIIMRSQKKWEEKVEELKTYHNLIILKNPRNPTLSPNNMKSIGDFEKILKSLQS